MLAGLHLEFFLYFSVSALDPHPTTTQL